MTNTNFTVTAEGNASSGTTTLNGAIKSIDIGGTNAATNTHYTITFGNGIALNDATNADLLAINLPTGSSLTIQGGNFFLDGQNVQRGFFVYSGAVDIHDLTIENTLAVGGNGGIGAGGGAGLGGGLFVASAGSVVLDNVSFSNSQAVGGHGGAATAQNMAPFATGGGGGGMGGNGGAGLSGRDAGGGIGLGANGGSNSEGAYVGGAGIVPGGSGTSSGTSGGGGNDVSHNGNSGGMGGGIGAGQPVGDSIGGKGGFGGGGASSFEGGIGGFGGGGGFGDSAGYAHVGAQGGFGGGGGGVGANSFGATVGQGGAGGFGGGNAGDSHVTGPVYNTAAGGGGGGGLGAGGDIFVQQGGSLTIEGGSLSGGSVAKGDGGASASVHGQFGGSAQGNAGVDGADYGSGIFIQGNETITFSPTSGQTTTISDVIADMTGSHDASGQTGQGNVVINGGGTVVFDAINTYTGTTTISQATTLELGNSSAAGTSEIIFQSASTGTLRIDGTTMPTNTIEGFATGDVIDLRGLAFTAGATASYNSTTDTLTVTSDNVTETLTLTGPTGTNLGTVSDGASGTAGTDVEFGVLTAPTVTSAGASGTSSANFTAAHTVTLTLDTSANVTVADGTTLLLSDGGTATYVSGSGTSTLVFTYSATDAPQALTITGIGAGSIEDNGSALTVDGTSVSPYTVAVTDSAANVSAHFNSLDTAVSYISSITLTDSGTPNLDLTASQIINDQTLIGLIGSSYNLVLDDSAANIGSNFNSLNNYASGISAVTFTGTGTPTLDLTAYNVVSDQALLGLIAPGSAHLVLHDSAGDIGSNLDALAAFQANAVSNGQEALSSVQFTDSGTPAIYLAAAQVVGDQALLGLISPGSVDLVLYDSASDIASNLAALNTHASELSWIQFTDPGTPTLDLTAAQVVSDQAILGLISPGSANLVLQDSGADIQANFDALGNFQEDAEINGQDALSSVQFTDGDTPTIVLSAGQVLNDWALIDLIAGSAKFVLKDNAADIQADFDMLNFYASDLSSVQFTDSGTPTIDLTALQVVNDQTLIGLVSSGSANLVLQDSAGDINAFFDTLAGEVGDIHAVQFTDGGTPDLYLTASEILNDQTFIAKIQGSYNLVLLDAAATITGDFSSLEQYASKISSIQFTDGGTPTIDLTAAQIVSYQSLIGEITSSYTLVLNDSAANIAADFDALSSNASEISSVVFTNSGTPNLDLTAYSILNDQALIGKLTPGSYKLVLSDTTANLASNFDALENYASEISSGQITGTGTPALDLTVYSLLNDRALIAKFLPDTYVLNVLDSLANISASFDTLETYASGIFTVRFTDSGTPTLDLTALQVVNDQTLIAKIVGSHTVVLEDSAANIAANFSALDSVATSFSSFSFTDSGTPALHLTASQIINDEFLISKLNFMAVHIVLDDAAATIVANIATLENDSSPLTSVEFTDSSTPTIDLTATVFVSSEPLIGKFTGPYDIALADSAATIQSDFGSLSSHASEITSIQFTDSGTPSLDLTAVQVVSDQTLIGKITGSYDLVVEDSTTNIASRFVGLETDAGEIASVQFTGSAPFALDLTAAETINDQALIGKITSTYSLVVKDSAATITSDLSSLEQYASEISSIQFTNSGTPTIDLTASQVASYQSLIEKFTGSYDLVVNDSAANIQANFDALENCVSEITSIQFTDSGTPNLDLTVAQVLGDQVLIGKIAGPYNLVLNDSCAAFEASFASLESYASEISSVVFTNTTTPYLALSAAEFLGGQSLLAKITSVHHTIVDDTVANIAANFDALESHVSGISAVAFTDSGTPTLDLTATQVANDASLLAKIYGAYDLSVTGVTGQAYTSYQSDYNASDALTLTTDFNTSGTETITAYAPGLTLSGVAAGNNFYLESSPSVTATGGAGNDLFFFGSGFSTSDAIDGAGGTNTLDLDGNYTSALTITSGLMSNIQTLDLLTGHTYDLALAAGTVTTSETLTVNASALAAGNALTFDGSALTAGTLVIEAGAGIDTLTGGAGTNEFFMAGYLTASDVINGGAGATTVNLDGDYSGGVTFTATTLVNVPTIDLATGHSYDLVLNAATVASGQAMTIEGNTLVAGNTMTIDGSALGTGSSLTIDGGAGVDILTGGAGTNEIVLRGFLTAADEINGGTGTTTVNLSGDYSAGVTFTATTMTNIDTLFMTAGHSYDFTLNAGTVASGQSMTIQGGALGAGDSMTIDGSAVTAGSLVIDAGAGSATMIGGAGIDTIKAGSGTDFIEGGLGADKLTAGSGADTFFYGAVNDSMSTGYDTISGFNTSGDMIQLGNALSAVTSVETAVTTGALGPSNFDTALAHSIGASQLSVHGAVLFTASTGGYAGDTFLIIDENGVAGYQAGQDLVIELTHGANLSSLSLANFETAA